MLATIDFLNIAVGLKMSIQKVTLGAISEDENKGKVQKKTCKKYGLLPNPPRTPQWYSLSWLNICIANCETVTEVLLWT